MRKSDKKKGLFSNIRELLPNNLSAFSYMFASLHSRNFRLYFMGMCVSLIGTWMQQIAMSWLVYRITGSVMLLATITVMAQLPILISTPFMGVLADRFDRRNLLIITQTASAAQALLLAWLTLSGRVEVWHLLSLSLLIGTINSLDTPVRQAFYTSLVPRESLTNAIALNSAVINGSRLIGPAVGGIVIGMIGEGYCFLVNGISYLAVIGALLAMRWQKSNYIHSSQKAIASLKEGFHYVLHNMPIRTLLCMMAAISMLGLPLVTFLPAYVKDILMRDSGTLGWLLSFVGIGSFSAAVCLAARKSVVGLGKMITISAMLMGVSLISLSFVRVAWLASLFCIPAGFCIIMTVASINSLLQVLSDEDKRGRVMGYLAMTFTGITPLGSLFLGWLEGYIGLPCVILISGIGCLSVAFVFEHFRPSVRKHTRPVFVRKGIIKEIAESIDKTSNENKNL